MSNIMNFYVGDEKAIVEEIMAWSAFALEKKNPKLNNLPACPYAKKAWEDERVSVIFKYGGTQSIYNAITSFSEDLDVVLIVDTFYNRDSDTFHKEIDDLNEQISNGMFFQNDIWLVGFHPDDDANDFVDDGTFEPHVNTPYALIFVQRLSKVHEASKTLMDLGYYTEYTKEYNIDEIFKKRETLYRRLKDGYESKKANGSGPL